MQNDIKLFEKKKIRSVYDEEKDKREQGQWQSCAPVGYLIYFISRKGSGNSFENGRYSVLVDV